MQYLFYTFYQQNEKDFILKTDFNTQICELLKSSLLKDDLKDKITLNLLVDFNIYNEQLAIENDNIGLILKYLQKKYI